MSDLYDILGVPKTATQEDIKSAYRKLAKQWHPDVNSDKTLAEAKFKEINRAYETLSDTASRATYDSGRTPFGSAGWRMDPFGNNYGPSRRRTPTNITCYVEISLVDVVTGTVGKLAVKRMTDCGACSGTGSSTSKRTTCGTCIGTGVRSFSRNDGFFSFVHQSPCGVCSGNGSIPEIPCQQCRGTGHSLSDERIDVAIPAGVGHGDILRVAGKGNLDGDLIIRLGVRPHDRFSRDGNDLLCDLEVPLATAICGGDSSLVGLSGENVPVRVPVACQWGQCVTLPGRGITGGDMNIRIVFSIPEIDDERRSKIAEILGQGTV